MTVLTERFDRALVFARQRHQGQYRKSTEIPYVTHPMSTAALVLEAGGDEDQAIAGNRFTAGRDDQLRCYRSLTDIYLRRGSPLAAEFDRVVRELEDLVAKHG